MSEIKVYHGSYCEVKQPLLDNGRLDADFGLGFYVTPDIEMAEKWASRKRRAIINEYILETENLQKYSFALNKEWLDYVIKNRNEYGKKVIIDAYDLVIGATADDKLYATIEQYESGFINADVAVEVLNCMKIGQQICIKSQSGLEKLHFIRSIELSPERVAELREHNRVDRKIANQIASEIIRKYNRRIR